MAEPIDELTVAMHLDSIQYDEKSQEYEIQLSAVKLLHFDIKNDVIRLKVPSHRLQRITTPTFNAENFDDAKYYNNKHSNGLKIKSVVSDPSDNDDDPNLDEITGIILTNDVNHDDYGDNSDEEKENDDEKAPKQANVDITPLQRHKVEKEWNAIIKKYKLNDDEWNMTKDSCFKRIIFILKHYTRWILYKDKHFKSSDIPDSKNEDFISITSLFNTLRGYDKIKLLNDYYYILKNVILDKSKTCCISANDLEQLIVNNSNILQCKYCLNRLNGSNSELYNLDKLSVSLRRDLYFINDANNNIKAGSVEERVEIGIQQYLDILYCSLLHPTNNGRNNSIKYTNNDIDGEYFTYWNPDHTQFCRAKYMDLKTELLSNTIYSIKQRDFFCLYNRAKDFLLSIMGKLQTAKRLKMSTKIKMEQKLTINHVIALLLYCNYYQDFVYKEYILKGCMRLNNEETFDDIRLRNNEIANWCRLLNEAIFCFGEMLIGDERLYYHINRKLSFKYMSIEYNIPISTTSMFTLLNNDEYKGIILRLGKFEATKEYNYAFNMCLFSNYPLENEYLIYGGKFEINDIIYNKETHYSDIESFKLYLQIMKGRWFSHNKLIFKKQYEKKLITFITRFIDKDNTEEKDYMQSLFENIIYSNGTTKKNKTIYVNKESDKLLPPLKKLMINKLIPYLTQNKENDTVFKKGYNTILTMKTNFNTINNSNFNKSLYSSEYKYQLLYLKNNHPQEIVFHFRCYRKKETNYFKGCFEIKQLPKCVSKCKIIGGLLIPQIQFEKWDFITLSPQKLYSGSSLFDIQKIKNFDSVLIKIAFQIKEVTDIDGKSIPTIDL